MQLHASVAFAQDRISSTRPQWRQPPCRGFLLTPAHNGAPMLVSTAAEPPCMPLCHTSIRKPHCSVMPGPGKVPGSSDPSLKAEAAKGATACLL